MPYRYGVSTREFLEHAMAWHGGNVNGHGTMIAYLPDEDVSVASLANRAFLWLTELMPALIGPTAVASRRGQVAQEFRRGFAVGRFDGRLGGLRSGFGGTCDTVLMRSI